MRIARACPASDSDVAVGRIDVRGPELAGEAPLVRATARSLPVACGSTSRSQRNWPGARSRLRPELADVVVQEVHAPPRRTRVPLRCRVGESSDVRAARCRSRRSPAARCGQLLAATRCVMSAQVSNGSTNPDRLLSSAVLPAERLHVLVHPDLEGLRRDGRDVLDHLAPARIARDELAADVRDRAESDAEHDEVEVLRRRAASSVRDPTLVPVRLEVDACRCQTLAVDELAPVGLGTASTAGRARRRAAGTRRRPTTSACTSNSSASTCGCSPGPAPSRFGEPDVLEPVEELEAHAAALQHLVERREDDVAHAGAHLPEERAAVGEERAQRCRAAPGRPRIAAARGSPSS